jgi:hypothetical protein
MRGGDSNVIYDALVNSWFCLLIDGAFIQLMALFCFIDGAF